MRHIRAVRGGTALAIVALLCTAVASLFSGTPATVAHTAPRPAAITLDVADWLVPPHVEPAPPPSPAPPPPPPPPPTAGVHALREQILSAFGSSTAGVMGIAVDIEGLGPVVDVNASSDLPPASTLKIYTGAGALLKLGPSYTYRTSVRRSGGLHHGVVEGDLAIIAGGDPTLSRATIEALAREVALAGIREVKGGLIADDMRYDRSRVGQSWKSSYVPRNSGSLSAFAIDGNRWRTDPAYIADPAAGNLELFRNALALAGVMVAGPNVVGPAVGNLELIAEHRSAPMSHIAAEMLKTSDNFYAEMMLKELGTTAGRPSSEGGVAVLNELAAELGTQMVAAVDGSGLSTQNRASARQEVEWLRKVDATPIGPMFRSALAVGCVPPGTMRNRLCGTSAQGKVFAKTGALPNTKTLTGYTTTASGRKVYFSFLLSQTQSVDAARIATDSALISIANFSG